MQKRAVRLVTNSYPCAASDPLFRQLNLLKIDDINKLHTAQFMFKVKHQLLPSSCMNYVTVTIQIVHT